MPGSQFYGGAGSTGEGHERKSGLTLFRLSMEPSEPSESDAVAAAAERVKAEPG